ncbi:odorant receptor 43b-like [Bactrocera tryoni]|uniref:odorant receptor 43b-like n=1 Tax=Bactrocera tryoni TaxID=59916 RepID=UPI001A98CE41|nr:odorant receptor 43b-like [Bactrocera tryoni]
MRKISDLFYGRGEDDFETTESFVLLFRSWAANGFLPKIPKRIVDIIHQIICWFCIFTCPVWYFAGLIDMMDDLPITLILSNLGVAINCIVLPLKAIYIKVHMNHLYDVHLLFKRLDERYQTSEEKIQIRESVKISTRIFAACFTLYWFYGIASGLVPLFAHEYPHGSRFPFIDWLPEGNFQYWLHSIVEMLYLQYLLHLQSTNDSFPAVYIHNIRTHIRLLTDRVSRLGLDPDLSDQQNLEELVDCIVSHQEILVISDTVGSILSLTTFFQFTVYAVLISVCMLNMFIFGDLKVKVNTLLYLIPVIWQTVPTCYESSMLQTDCTKFPEAIFHCNWLALDKRCHKLIIYFMQRSQEEICFTAIKLFQINLGTNLSIAKFSFTLYTFIKEMGLDTHYNQQ